MNMKPASLSPCIPCPLFLILSLALSLLAPPLANAFPQGLERHRIYVYLGGGYAADKYSGPVAELGADLRLMGDIYARIELDYYFGAGNEKKEGQINSAYGASGYLTYKAKLSETFSLALFAGAHYTTRNHTIVLYGVSVEVWESAKGYAGGLGLEFQLNNRLLLALGATFKYIPDTDSETWLKLQLGFRYRLY